MMRFRIRYPVFYLSTCTCSTIILLLAPHDDFRLLIRGYCLLETVVLFAEDSVRVRWITNGDTSNGIFSRADSSEIGLFCISVSRLVHGSTLMRDPSGRAAICSRLFSCR